MGLFDLFGTPDINAYIEQYEKIDGAVLVDVRTAEEYRSGHIENSINIPVDRISSIKDSVKDRDTQLYVYCYSGGRSGRAVSHLKQIGYKNVKNIGGISKYRGKVVI